MSEEHDFEIDIYGDAPTEMQPDPTPADTQPPGDQISDDKGSGGQVPAVDQASGIHDLGNQASDNQASHDHASGDQTIISQPAESVEAQQDHQGDTRQTQVPHLQTQSAIASTSADSGAEVNAPKVAPTEQGKGKVEGASDERPVDAGATTALKIVDMQWWVTEDDIRGWANQCGVEDELKGVTFAEYKVNGKSKG